MHNSHRSLRNINLMISASMKRPRLCFFIIFFCQQRQKKMKDRRVRGCKKRIFKCQFSHFLLFGKKRSQKSEAGLCPAPAALPTAFYGRRGSFLLTNETPMEHGFHRLVIIFYPLFSFPHHGCVVGVWLFRGVEAPPPTKR